MMSNIIHVDFKGNKPKWEEYHFTISTHFVQAIKYDDISELDQDDISELDQFMEEFNNPTFSWKMEYDSVYLTCDITGRKSDCWEVTVTDQVSKREVI